MPSRGSIAPRVDCSPSSATVTWNSRPFARRCSTRPLSCTSRVYRSSSRPPPRNDETKLRRMRSARSKSPGLSALRTARRTGRGVTLRMTLFIRRSILRSADAVENEALILVRPRQLQGQVEAPFRDHDPAGAVAPRDPHAARAEELDHVLPALVRAVLGRV